jgi:hypothetical protein
MPMCHFPPFEINGSWAEKTFMKHALAKDRKGRARILEAPASGSPQGILDESPASGSNPRLAG